LSLNVEELRSLAERGDLSATGAYRASRYVAGMKRSMEALPAADRQVVVLELEHG
jgi:hypothetical protein